MCTGLRGMSLQSGFVMLFCRDNCLRDTPTCVPSHANMCGSYLHQGSISICAIQEKNHFTKVTGLMNLTLKMLLVWYLLFISLQNAVNEIFEDFTSDTKSHPISSPAHVLLDRKCMESCPPSYVRQQLFSTHFLENTLHLIAPYESKFWILNLV